MALLFFALALFYGVSGLWRTLSSDYGSTENLHGRVDILFSIAASHVAAEYI